MIASPLVQAETTVAPASETTANDADDTTTPKIAAPQTEKNKIDYNITDIEKILKTRIVATILNGKIVFSNRL